MKFKVNQLKLFYHGINYDIEQICHLCPVCMQKNIKFYKRQPCKQIIMTHPKERYVIDLTYLPEQLCKNNKYKYLFNIEIHFSKFIISYPISNKFGKTIKQKLLDYFNKFGKLEQIGSDNGSKFVNNHVKNL